MISHLTFIILIQVCDDIDECKGPDNGGCTANSVCHNSVVSNCRILSEHGSCRAIISFVRMSKKPDVFVLAQGSYHCGSCKTGFTGDQVKGCKPEISCGNSLTNPCDINAQCKVERDGSIHCQVGFYSFFTHIYYLHTHWAQLHRHAEFLKSFLFLDSVESAGPVTDTCVGRIPTLTDTQMKNSNAKIQAVKR